MKLLKCSSRKDIDDKYYISVAVECLDVKNNDKTKDNKKR